MNMITRGLFLTTLVFSPMVLSSDLMNYCLESSEVLNCDMMCFQNENFVPVFPKPNGDCPKNPSQKWLDLNNPITLDQICELETEMIDTTDAYGRPLGPQVNTIFTIITILFKNQTKMNYLCKPKERKNSKSHSHDHKTIWSFINFGKLTF